jgi:succinate dehydrogenase flavin-adding protein (antitoxin of CptAB toxin-antitoxin module)
MQELDLLLERYLDKDFGGASLADQRAFASLLDLPDPVLWSYFMGREQPETEEQRRVIAHLRRTPGN